MTKRKDTIFTLAKELAKERFEFEADLYLLRGEIINKDKEEFLPDAPTFVLRCRNVKYE